MRLTGMAIGFIDVPPEDHREYNRWWDLTMGPANAALPELVLARRYYADDECQQLRGPVEEKGLQVGRARYCHVYGFGVEELAAAQAAMADLAKRLDAEGRNFGRGWSRYQGPLRLVASHARPELRADPEAIPWLGHTAVQFSIGIVTDRALLRETEAWYDEVHLPDLVETPGFLAALRLLPIDPEREGRFVNVFLLDEEPAKALAAFRERVAELREGGRLSSPGGAVRLLFGGPFRPLVPLRYPFLE